MRKMSQASTPGRGKKRSFSREEAKFSIVVGKRKGLFLSSGRGPNAVGWREEK